MPHDPTFDGNAAVEFTADTAETGVKGVNGVKPMNDGENSSDTKAGAKCQRCQREEEISRPEFRTHDDWCAFAGDEGRKPGLYHHGQDKEGDPVDTWICSPIYAEAMTEDESGNSQGLLLRFKTARGKWREWAAPLHMLKGSGEELRGELLDQGMRIDPRRRSLLALWLMEQHPDDLIVAATRTGWHGDAFVLPGRTIGDQTVRFQSEHAAHDDFMIAGSLEGWQSEVAARCRGNRTMLFAVSVALAGPLVKAARLSELGGALFHFTGDSGKGKTTSLQAAGSAWGPPAFVRTWRSTANGLEATASALNDTVLILDEISECDPREIGSAVYMIGNGEGKGRARRTGGQRARQRWRLVGLSSGERTLAAHMAEGGRRSKAGQEARMLDTPATRCAHGAFDDLHGHADGRAFADAIKQATARHYGHAGPAFVEALLSDAQDLPGMYAKACDLPDFAHQEELEGRAASWFALVAMAGELATDHGVVPWESGEALDAAVWAYRAWREYRGRGQTEDRQILQSVRQFIERHGDSRFSSRYATETQPVRDRAGYWEDTDEGRVYYLNSAALHEAAAGFDLHRVLDALEAARWLHDREARSRSIRVTVRGQTTRAYAIRPDMEGEQ